MTWWYLLIILAYLLVLAGFNFWRSRKVKSQEDFMVAGRKLPLSVMVLTLICTWIGSGTFIAGAEYAAKAGWSSMWMPAGAWLGIIVIFFLAKKIRTFGQYTVGDILEERYGKFARIFGAVAIVIAFTTIVSYQFRAGGYILEVVTQGAISKELGQMITAGFVILFTVLGGMVAVAHTDLPNGIIIVLACAVATPFVVMFAGGWDVAPAMLPPGHFETFSADFGEYPALKAGGYFLATMMLLMGIQSMYQKFYSARSPKDAKAAVAIWIVGTILVEILVIVIAIYGAAYHWTGVKEYEISMQLREEVKKGESGVSELPDRIVPLVNEQVSKGLVRTEKAAGLVSKLQADLKPLLGNRETFLREVEHIGTDPRSIVLVAAEDIASRGGLGLIFGILLLAAACAVVISTGMNYLLSPATNVMRDVYQRFVNRDAQQSRMVALQRITVAIIGFLAFLMVFLPAVLHSEISVLKYSMFAYTMYGVSITPALIAALTWKRATRAGGVASILGGAFMALVFELIPYLAPQVMRGTPGSQDPWGIPSIYPALGVSVLLLVVVSLLAKKPDPASLSKLFPEKVKSQN